MQQISASQIRRSQPTEDQLRIVIDSLPVPASIHRPDGSICLVNRLWTAYTGIPFDDANGSEGLMTIHSEDAPSFASKWAAARSAKVSFEIQARMRQADGVFRWFLILRSPFHDAVGEVVKWYGTYIDINDRKKAEDALSRTETHLVDAQRLAHAGSWVWSAALKENTYWSHETYRIYGFDPERDTCSCEKAMERIHPDDVSTVKKSFEVAMQKRTGMEVNFRVVVPNQAEQIVHCVAHPVFDAERNLVEFVGTIMNVTEQQKSIAGITETFETARKQAEQLHLEAERLRQKLNPVLIIDDIIGASTMMQQVLEQVIKVAPTDSSVLIIGETGTGKSRVAKAIHKLSNRSARPFIHVNCGGIPGAELPTGLFENGRCNLTGGETIYLDEIGELSLPAQAIILKILQEQEVQPEDGDLSNRFVRILASTSRDLHAAVEMGTFRSELFYRLNVVPIRLPALRERPEDITSLAEYFAKLYGRRNGKNITGIDDRAKRLLPTYAWPGNVRELRNLVERAVALCNGETLCIDASWLDHQIPQTGKSASIPMMTLEDHHRDAIKSALEKCKGRVSGPHGAAAQLGIPRSTLESKIRNLKINKYEFK